jgi:hypothetical protein
MYPCQHRIVTEYETCVGFLELIHAGATVVEANFDDLPSLCKAFDGIFFQLIQSVQNELIVESFRLLWCIRNDGLL